VAPRLPRATVPVRRCCRAARGSLLPSAPYTTNTTLRTYPTPSLHYRLPPRYAGAFSPRTLYCLTSPLGRPTAPACLPRLYRAPHYGWDMGRWRNSGGCITTCLHPFSFLPVPFITTYIVLPVFVAQGIGRRFRGQTPATRTTFAGLPRTTFPHTRVHRVAPALLRGALSGRDDRKAAATSPPASQAYSCRAAFFQRARRRTPPPDMSPTPGEPPPCAAALPHLYHSGCAG